MSSWRQSLKSADKFEKSELGSCVTELAKGGLLEHCSPCREGTEGLYRRNILWFGYISSSSFDCPLYLPGWKAFGQFFFFFKSILRQWWMIYPNGYRFGISKNEDCWQGELRKDKADGCPERTQICVQYKFYPECPHLQQKPLHHHVDRAASISLPHPQSDTCSMALRVTTVAMIEACISQWLQKLMNSPTLRDYPLLARTHSVSNTGQ